MDLIAGQGNWIRGVGPFLSNSDGVTHISSVGLAGDVAAIEKKDGTVDIIASNSFLAVGSMAGDFDLYLANSNCDQAGQIKLSIIDSSFHLPVFQTINLVNSAFYEAKYGSVKPALSSEVSSVQAAVDLLPNSSAVRDQFLTLPNSEELNAHIITLPTSEEVNAHVLTMPTSESLHAEILTLPTSQTVNAHIITLPTSDELNAHVLTLPDSSTVRDQFLTLPNSEELNAHVITLPTSEELNVQILTLPNSSGVLGIITTQFNNYGINHLLINSSGLGDIADFSVFGRLMGRDGTADNFVSSSDSLQGIAEGAAGGGASVDEVQSACFDVIQDMNLDHLMKTPVGNSSDLTTEVPDYTVMGLMLTAGGNTSAFVSSDDSLQAISEGAAGGGASVAEVQSACFDAYNGILPNSEEVNAHILTLPTSLSLHAEILTLPTSQTLNAHVITLPNSQVVNAHIITLANSEAVFNMISSLDVRVSSVNIAVSSIQTGVDLLPNSETLNAHLLTLPTSLTLEAQINTLPTSETLNGHIITLPDSSTIRDQFLTMANSQTINAHFLTMPTSQMVSLVSSNVMERLITNSVDMIEAQRIMVAGFTGVTSGGGTGTYVFRNTKNDKTLFTVTVDSDTNRSSVVLGDLS